MAKKSKIQYHLSDVCELSEFSENDINAILRAADEIIFVGGRTMLAKILKGSKDKKVLEKKLDQCPVYGYYHDYSIDEITKKIDWMIVNGFLQIDYNGRLPMIIFTDKGWTLYKPVYASELLELLLSESVEISEKTILKLNQTNREVVEMLLNRIAESGNIGFIPKLNQWKLTEVKKVRVMINKTITKLESRNESN